MIAFQWFESVFAILFFQKMETIVKNGMSEIQIWSFLGEDYFLHLGQMIVVSESDGKNDDLIKHNAVITLAKNPKFCERIDDNRNQNPDEH